MRNGSCSTERWYYWEWSSPSGYNLNDITSPTPLGSHEFTIERMTSGCATGISWCWHFNIDATKKHTCCGEDSALANGSRVDFEFECIDGNLNLNCPANGSNTTPNTFLYMDTGGAWAGWAGTDAACVDYNRGARGKWDTARGADGGYHVSLSGSLTNHCQ